MRTVGENRASEQSAKELSLEQAELVKRKSVDTFNANEQDTFTPEHFKKSTICGRFRVFLE